MERFTVNGTEVEYDIFDLDVMDGYQAGLALVAAAFQATQEDESPTDTMRRKCNAMLDFFDDQLGEGKAEELFGLRLNIKAIYDGYLEFIGQVNACLVDYSKTVQTELAAPAMPSNRAKRREERRKQKK